MTGRAGRKSLSPRRHDRRGQHADQFYEGKTAAVTRKLGKGSVTYIGVESLGGELETHLLRGVFTRAGVKVEYLTTASPWTGATVSGWPRTLPRKSRPRRFRQA